jgi:hypothetical protein
MYNDRMSDLYVNIERYEKGEVHGHMAFRLIVRRTGEATRGVYTIQRLGERDADTIDRLVKYHAENELPVHVQNEPLQEV